jgi:hypothetical protein
MRMISKNIILPIIFPNTQFVLMEFFFFFAMLGSNPKNMLENIFYLPHLENH